MTRIEKMISMRNDGKTLREIGKRFGITSQAVSLALIKVGCKKPPTPEEARISEIVMMRNDNVSLQNIADHFKITKQRVSQLLKNAGYHGQPLFVKRASAEQKAEKRKREIAYIAEWQKRNLDKVRQYRKGYKKRRSDRDPGYRVHHNLQRRIQGVLKGDRKADSSVDLIGCTPDQLRAHLEAQFQPGMTWDNYGVFGWHVDHIISCWRFDRSDPDWQRKCFHYTNLQPLWREDNMAKRDHWGQI